MARVSSLTKQGRIALAITIAVFGAAAGLCVYGVAAYLRHAPTTVNFAAGHVSGQPVNLTAQTVGTYGHAPHPSWVSYLVRSPGGRWKHTTLWELPAHTRINVTLYEYDTGSPLRNEALGLVQGTTGNSYLLNGKKVSVLNSNVGNGVAHTFTVPAMGINVPLWGVSSSAKNACSQAPCSQSSAHNTIKFSFMTGNPGQYRWQCFVPCGASYLDGNAGPMQTVGYMDGFLAVVAS